MPRIPTMSLKSYIPWKSKKITVTEEMGANEDEERVLKSYAEHIEGIEDVPGCLKCKDAFDPSTKSKQLCEDGHFEATHVMERAVHTHPKKGYIVRAVLDRYVSVRDLFEAINNGKLVPPKGSRSSSSTYFELRDKNIEEKKIEVSHVTRITEIQ